MVALILAVLAAGALALAAGAGERRRPRRSSLALTMGGAAGVAGVDRVLELTGPVPGAFAIAIVVGYVIVSLRQPAAPLVRLDLGIALARIGAVMGVVPVAAASRGGPIEMAGLAALALVAIAAHGNWLPVPMTPGRMRCEGVEYDLGGAPVWAAVPAWQRGPYSALVPQVMHELGGSVVPQVSIGDRFVVGVRRDAPGLRTLTVRDVAWPHADLRIHVAATCSGQRVRAVVPLAPPPAARLEVPIAAVASWIEHLSRWRRHVSAASINLVGQW